METPPLSPQPDPVPPALPPPSGGLTERQWAIILHLSGLFGLLLPALGNIIAPMIVWMIKKDNSPLLDQTGKDVLNFQISYTIYVVLAGLSIFVCVGYVLAPLITIAWLVFVIIGAVKASNGERYDFPLTIKML